MAADKNDQYDEAQKRENKIVWTVTELLDFKALAVLLRRLEL